MGVLGENNNSVIEGALIARGQDIIPVVNVAPDYESYEYTRLDLNKPEDKAFFEAALAWDLESGGKKWADGKNVCRPSFYVLSLNLLTFATTASVQVKTNSLVRLCTFHAWLASVVVVNTYIELDLPCFSSRNCPADCAATPELFAKRSWHHC